MKTILCLCFGLLVSTAGFSQGCLEQFRLRQQTKYFDFRFKQNPEKIKAIARFADGFVSVVNRDFFKADFDYPIVSGRSKGTGSGRKWSLLDE